MKKLLLFVLSFTLCTLSYANHLKGGWIYYEYQGRGAAPNTSTYTIIVNQYLLCSSSSGQIDEEIFLGIYDRGTRALYRNVTIPLWKTDFEQRDSFNACISNPPTICYRIDRYTTTIDLPDNTAGYVLDVQRCCRIGGIVNVTHSNATGITYTTSIPGVVNNIAMRDNNSPQFIENDAVVVCVNSKFTFDFSATDGDRDSLAYHFCSGLNGGDSTPNGARPNPPLGPPFVDINYARGYSGDAPLGPEATIDEKTGIVSGIAPGVTGDYVVAVCAQEFRGGIFIGQTKKEIHITVANCQLAGAVLKPSYITCDGFNFNFQNESAATDINSYLWDFGENSGTSDTSSQPTPTHSYKDTGTYKIKLVVANANGCEDSASSLLKIYPGFAADFKVNQSCLQNPFQFTDATATVYGFVNTWSWDFGDLNSVTDTSVLQNPSYQYTQVQTANVRLIATNSKGCIDTAYKTVDVRDKPLISVPFKDTLICSIDSLQLSASTDFTAAFSWTPTTNIRNASGPDPIVFPKDTTDYIVTVDDGHGCRNSDTIRVNVIDRVTLDIGRDTTICSTDTINFNPVSNALHFLWAPADSVSNAAIKNPFAVPHVNQTYLLTANVGRCNATDQITVKTAPYPIAYAGPDTLICFGTNAQLKGAITGDTYGWSPVSTLGNPGTLSPLARPLETTTYILTARYNTGCPKPGFDSVTVNVTPKIIAFAGNDTSIVANQPLQLNATGGEFYSWSPPTGMNNPNIYNPLVTLGTQQDTITYHVRVSTAAGCANSDSMKVTIFKTLPELFIPSGFTPNADGRNDVIRPVLAGIKSLNYFRVYNRWGQMLFSTSQPGKGWDGTFNGQPQASGTYVYQAEAVDYLNRTLVQKGTLVLIR